MQTRNYRAFFFSFQEWEWNISGTGYFISLCSFLVSSLGLLFNYILSGFCDLASTASVSFSIYIDFLTEKSDLGSDLFSVIVIYVTS